MPALSGKISRGFRHISRGGALHMKGERKSSVVPPFPESPRCLCPLQGNMFSLHFVDYQDEDRLTPRWHLGQPCGKASWESLEGKTQIPRSTRREARHCCYSSEGKCTCMPPLETRTDSPGETPEVPQVPCQHWRGILSSDTDATQGLRPWHRRERKPEKPLRGPRTIRMGTCLS